MKQVSIQDLKARLSAVVAEAEAGGTILVTRHNQPVAQLGPAAAAHLHRGTRAASTRLGPAVRRGTRGRYLALLLEDRSAPGPAATSRVRRRSMGVSPVRLDAVPFRIVTATSLEAELRRLVDEYRSRCLWFLRPDFYPTSKAERDRVLTLIVQRGDGQAFRRVAELRAWLSRSSSETSAAS